MSGPRIFERVIVIDDDGKELYRFTREMDPRYYVLINIPPEADYVTREQLLTEPQAEEFMRCP
jgi:hypothetical protein